jgi:hypothetical protein
MREKAEEKAVNVRKIPMSLEVGFWNIIIAFLTIFRDIRTFSQTTPAPMPSLRRRNNAEKLISNPNKLISPNIKIRQTGFKLLLLKACLWALLGFSLGFLSALLIGF